MTKNDLKDILAHVQNLMHQAEKLLIVVSDPIDPDCVGTALALTWLLTQQPKHVEVISLFRIPPEMTDFPKINDVSVVTADSFDSGRYNIIVLVDGCDWTQFLGKDWKEITARIDLSKVINLDHHFPGDIQKTIPERCFNVKTSSTAQLLYDYFIKPSGVQLPPDAADSLYRALLYDTRNFKNEMHPGAYNFAADLITSGAHHAKAVDVNFEMQEFTFLAWAVDHTEFIPELQLSLLVLDARAQNELQKRISADWKDFDRLYKEVVERQIKGYNYGIILIDNLDGSIRLGWRTRSYGDHLSIGDIARGVGFHAGGHRNAGGGRFSGTIDEAKARLLNAIRHALDESAAR